MVEKDEEAVVLVADTSDVSSSGIGIGQGGVFSER